jgi:hypothetical protein
MSGIYMNINCYFDFSASFGEFITKATFTNYQVTPYVLNITALDAYVTAIFTQMQGAGQKTIILAFAQVDNISVYKSGNFTQTGADITTDAIVMVLHQLAAANIKTPGYSDLLNYFIAKAHDSNIKVIISFGGQAAVDASWALSDSSAAADLLSFLITYQLDGVDFDVEDSNAVTTTLISFFQTLHTALVGTSKTMTLTLMLGSQWRTAFSAITTDFANYFDGLNLMAYSDTQYYICADDPTDGWGISDWITFVGVKNAGMVNLGFDDGIPYATAAANASQGSECAYTITSGSSDGSAAAQIYTQLLSKLAPTLLGTPFFWPNENGNASGRYKPGTTTNTSQFVSQDMIDFFTDLTSEATGTLSITLSGLQGVTLPSPCETTVGEATFIFTQPSLTDSNSLPYGTYTVTAPIIPEYTATVSPSSVTLNATSTSATVSISYAVSTPFACNVEILGTPPNLVFVFTTTGQEISAPWNGEIKVNNSYSLASATLCGCVSSPANQNSSNTTFSFKTDGTDQGNYSITSGNTNGIMTSGIGYGENSNYDITLITVNGARCRINVPS